MTEVKQSYKQKLEQEQHALLEICNGLGSWEVDENGESHFYGSEDHFDNIKDVLRFLRRDDPVKRHFRNSLGKWNVLPTKLLPLLLQNKEDEEICFYLGKIIVLLTMPIIKENVENHLLELQYLQTYKEAFLSQEILSCLMQLLIEPLSHKSTDRTESDNVFIELIVTLFRNLLLISDKETTETDRKGHLHQELISAFQRDNILEFFVIVAQSLGQESEISWNVILLESFYLVLRKETPRSLWNTWKENNANPIDLKKEKNDKLLALVSKEKKERYNSTVTVPRHTRFGGVYVIKSEKNNHETLYTEPIRDRNLVSQRVTKSAPRLTRNKTIADHKQLPSNKTVQLHLKDFCDKILSTCFNDFIVGLLKDLSEKGAYPTDKENFLWFVRFMVEYSTISCENSEIEISQISRCLHPKCFEFVSECCNEYTAEKKWSSLEVSGETAKVLFSALFRMLKSKNKEIKKAAVQLTIIILHDRALLLDRTLTLIRIWTGSKQTKSLLRNLIETANVMLKILEPVAQQTAAVDYSGFLRAFANPSVLSNYHAALSNYKENSSALNYSIIRLFTKLCENHELIPKFFQLSFFKLYNTILQDETIKNDSSFKKIFKFCRDRVSDFFRIAKECPVVFVELLFLKNNIDCDAIAAYDPNRPIKRKKQRKKSNVPSGGNLDNDKDDDEEIFDDAIEESRQRKFIVMDDEEDENDSEKNLIETQEFEETLDDPLEAELSLDEDDQESSRKRLKKKSKKRKRSVSFDEGNKKRKTESESQEINLDDNLYIFNGEDDED